MLPLSCLRSGCQTEFLEVCRPPKTLNAIVLFLVLFGLLWGCKCKKILMSQIIEICIINVNIARLGTSLMFVSPKQRWFDTSNGKVVKRLRMPERIGER